MTGQRSGDEFEARVHPTRDDTVVAAVSDSIGGPMGEHASPHRFWSPLRVLMLLTALCFAVGMVQKAPCANSAWQNGAENFNNMCYSDLPPLYGGRGLAEGHWPYSDDPVVRARFDVMEYPVGISYWAWATAKVTRAIAPDEGTGSDVATEARLFTAVNAVGLALMALLTTGFLAGVTRRRPWDAAGFALAPTLALTALINWDLLAVMLVAAALWAWARERPVLTGVLIGLGTAAKLYPLFLLGGILIICLRRLRSRDPERSDPLLDFGAVTGAAAVAWLVVNAPAYLTGPAQWKVFWAFNSERGADLGSIWLVLQQALDRTMEPSLINKVSWLFFGAWCVGVLVLGLTARATPRLAQLGLLVVAGFLLVNKVYSPQYVLWLLPLAVLARPRWRDLLIWQAGEVVYFAAVWWYLGEYLAPAGGGDSGFYWLAILVRIAAELYLVAVVVRDIVRPSGDPVREPVPGSSAPAPRPWAASRR